MRSNLEKYQVLIYIGAIVAGLLLGTQVPQFSSALELFIWPALGILLYATFTQVSFAKVSGAFRDRRFINTALIGNFIFIPLIVLGLITLLPDSPAIRLGVALVLLVPCTDWFITFTNLGGGDTERAIAFSPVSLLFQILLLPIYLFLFLGDELTVSLATDELLIAFTTIILLPLGVAWFTQRWVNKEPEKRSAIIAGMVWLPVPLLALVIFLIAGSQADVIFTASSQLIYPAIVFVFFLIISAVLAKVMARFTMMPKEEGRALAFSFGSRNSFVVLPVALALPESFEITAFIVVMQSLIELFGMAAYLWIIPKVLFREKG